MTVWEDKMDLIMYILMDSSHYSSKPKCTSLKYFHEHYGHCPIFSGPCGMPESNYDPDLRLLRPSPHSWLIRIPMKCRTPSILHISSLCKLHHSCMINCNSTSYGS